MPKTALVREEIRILFRLSMPIVATSFLSYSMHVVDLSFVGHLGKSELAAAALGHMLFSAIVYPMMDVTSALETYMSQCYGAGSYRAYGEWLITGVAVASIVQAPVLFLLWNSKDILLLLAQGEALSEMGQEFTRWLILGIPPFFVFWILVTYLQTQHILAPLVWIGLASNILNIILNYVFIFTCDLGFKGSPIATSVTRWVQLLMTLVYLHCSPAHRRTWPTWSTTPLSLNRIVKFLKLGIFGAMAMAFEVWCFEVATILAGLLGEVALGTQAVLMSLVNLTFMSVQYPFANGAQIRLGNNLGANEPEKAKLTMKVALGMVCVMMIIVTIIMIAARHQIGLIFTSDPEVLQAVSDHIYIAALMQLFDGLQCTEARLFVGMGHQRFLVFQNTVGLWAIGVPLGTVLAFQADMKLAGLWWGFVVGLASTATLGLVYLACFVNWNKEAELAVKRAGEIREDTGMPFEKLDEEMQEPITPRNRIYSLN